VQGRNTQRPLAPTLSKSQTADVESFLLDVLGIFPLLGLGVFEKTEQTSKPIGELLFIESKGIKATGYEDPKGFVVLKGSQVLKEEQAAIHNYMSALRKDLVAQGVLVESGQSYVVTQDHVFGSPSTAAGVVLGRASNGRKDWKNKEGTSLREIQEAAANNQERSAGV